MNLRRRHVSGGSISLIVRTFGLALSLAKVGESQGLYKPGEWLYRRLELRDPLVSGIRSLEYLRRLVIDDKRVRKSEDRTFSLFDDRESAGQEYSRGSVGEDLSVDGKYPTRRQVSSAMYEALSRLANVRVDETSKRGNFEDENLQQRDLREPAHRGKIFEFGHSRNANGTKNETSSSFETAKVFDSSRLSGRKFQCSPINEIYIPNVEKKMPAYLCTLGGRAFVVSSERFNQESRERFSVSLDDDTYMRLNPIRSGSTTLTSAVSVLPATLVLKRNDGDYTVRARQR